MGRTSSLDVYRDQIAEWIRQGKTDHRLIQALLKERGLEISHQAVGNYVKKMLAPTLAKVAHKADVQLGTIEHVLTEAISRYAELRSRADDKREMTREEHNYYRALNDAFSQIVKLYTPNITQVAIQVNVQEAKEKLWAILKGEETT